MSLETKIFNLITDACREDRAMIFSRRYKLAKAIMAAIAEPVESSSSPQPTELELDSILQRKPNGGLE